MSSNQSEDGLDVRARDIFQRIVESYLTEGEPVGSRSLSKQLPVSLSPASIRNVMSDLEDMGLIYSPHISAGRMPTEQGLRYFVDAFMDAGEVDPGERALIDSHMQTNNAADSTENMLTEASQLLSRMSRGAGLVVAPKHEQPLKHIEFVQLEETRVLVVLVWENGDVENRLLEVSPGTTTSQLAEAANFLNHHARGHTLQEARGEIETLRQQTREELDGLSAALVERGLAVMSGGQDEQPTRLIVRGRSNLIESMDGAADVERVKLLLDDLERKDEIVNLLDLAQAGSGVRIFIGSENRLFSLSGSSLIVAPYQDSDRQVVGAIGVIGPTRLNYARIVPMVDYTARMISQMIKK